MKEDTKITEDMLIEAHKHCTNNKQEIEKSSTCGCFYCREIFAPKEIKTWINEGIGTAQCPYCLIDSVIGDASGVLISKNLLDKMYKKWFGNNQ